MRIPSQLTTALSIWMVSPLILAPAVAQSPGNPSTESKCRCQYPGESISEPNGNQLRKPMQVIPREEELCRNIVYVCPGKANELNLEPWYYNGYCRAFESSFAQARSNANANANSSSSSSSSNGGDGSNRYLKVGHQMDLKVDKQPIDLSTIMQENQPQQEPEDIVPVSTNDIYYIDEGKREPEAFESQPTDGTDPGVIAESTPAREEEPDESQQSGTGDMRDEDSHVEEEGKEKDKGNGKKKEKEEEKRESKRKENTKGKDKGNKRERGQDDERIEEEQEEDQEIYPNEIASINDIVVNRSAPQSHGMTGVKMDPRSGKVFGLVEPGKRRGADRKNRGADIMYTKSDIPKDHHDGKQKDKAKGKAKDKHEDASKGGNGDDKEGDGGRIVLKPKDRKKDKSKEKSKSKGKNNEVDADDVSSVDSIADIDEMMDEETDGEANEADEADEADATADADGIDEVTNEEVDEDEMVTEPIAQEDNVLPADDADAAVADAALADATDASTPDTAMDDIETTTTDATSTAAVTPTSPTTSIPAATSTTAVTSASTTTTTTSTTSSAATTASSMQIPSSTPSSMPTSMPSVTLSTTMATTTATISASGEIEHSATTSATAAMMDTVPTTVGMPPTTAKPTATAMSGNATTFATTSTDTTTTTTTTTIPMTTIPTTTMATTAIPTTTTVSAAKNAAAAASPSPTTSTSSLPTATGNSDEQIRGGSTNGAKSDWEGSDQYPSGPSYVVLPANHDYCKCTEFTLDFEHAESGSPLQGGTYAEDEWEPIHGIRIHAHSVSYGNAPTPTPLRPYIFDTSKPAENGLDNSLHDLTALGNPNKDCGGPGEGTGGDLSHSGRGAENCNPLGNVLITTTSFKEASEDAVIQITFDHPVVWVEDVVMLNVADDSSMVGVYTTDDREHVFPLKNTGPNGVQRLPIQRHAVDQLFFDLHSIAAIASIQMCIKLDQ